MPVLSIVVPAFNAERYLQRCLESLSRQHLEDWEAIVVDDGSADATLEMARRVACHDPRIRVYSVRNGGAAAARNFGMDRARGEYIGFVDADDWVGPEMYSELVQHARRGGYDSVGCDLVFETSNRSWTETADVPPGAYDRAMIEREFFPQLLTSNRLEREWPYRLVTKIYNRQLMNHNGIRFARELRAAQDFTFSVEAMFHCQSFYYATGLTSYHYLQNRESRTHSPLAGAFENYASVDEEYERILGDSPEFDQQRSVAMLHGKLSALTYHYRGARVREWRSRHAQLRNHMGTINFEPAMKILDWPQLSKGKRVACMLIRHRRWRALNATLTARARLRELVK